MSVTRTCPTCGYTHAYATAGVADTHFPRHSCTYQQQLAEAARRSAERAASGIKRDCRHPGAPHTHGERAAYVKDRCRCPHCTAANTAASTDAKRQQTFGNWNPYVDASPLRAHIDLLRREGIGYEQIAKLARTSATHLREIAGATRRSANRPTIRRVRQATADRVLAIEPSATNRAFRSQVDATGTRRRLQALAAIGWNQPRLAAELGRTVGNLNRSMNADSVLARTAQLVNDLYERLWDVAPPQTTTAERNAANAARADAREHGWLPPLAWDDIDSDPDPDPTTPSKTDPNDLDEIAIERAVAGDGIRLEHLTPAEQAEAVRRLTERGKSIRDIADQLATTKRTVSRRRESAVSAA